MRGVEIDIHFVGWHESWDETIDVSEEPQRIRHGDEEVPRGHVDSNGDSMASASREQRQHNSNRARMQVPGTADRQSYEEDGAGMSDTEGYDEQEGGYNNGQQQQQQQQQMQHQQQQVLQGNEARREMARQMAQQQFASPPRSRAVQRGPTYAEYAAELRRAYGEDGGLVGLRNLGNTCYMNSALQCLCAIPQMAHYFLDERHLDDINNRYSPSKTKVSGDCLFFVAPARFDLVPPPRPLLSPGPARCRVWQGCPQRVGRRRLLDGHA